MAVSPEHPIITLTTDFGLTDHYAGTMKGVILERCPNAHIVDISHQVPAFSVWSGAYSISQAAPYFPAGSIHVVVVDPGVGTDRRAILAEASGQLFIAPDNGVLSLVLEPAPQARVREITRTELFRPAVSSTFHGRDVFAPVAAALASGVAGPESVGCSISDFVLLHGIQPKKTGPGQWLGRVLSVDHFGNVITNFKVDRFSPGGFTVEAPLHTVREFRNTFGDAGRECFSYFGSSGYIELGINQQSAAAFLGIHAGDTVLLYERGAR